MSDAALDELERKLAALEHELARVPRAAPRPSDPDPPRRDAGPTALGSVETPPRSVKPSPPSTLASALAPSPGPFPMRPPFTVAPAPAAPPAAPPFTVAPAPAAPPAAPSALVAPAPPPPPVAPSPQASSSVPAAERESRPVAPAAVPVGLEALTQARAELERASRAFMLEYERLLGGLLAGADDALEASRLLSNAGSVAGRPQAPPPIDDVVARRDPSAADDGEAAAAEAPAGDAVLDGAVTVDAGQFTDIATLTAFEHALVAVDGVRDVYVRGFEGGHAFLDVTLDRPTALGRELRQFTPVAFRVARAGPRHLTVVIDPSA